MARSIWKGPFFKSNILKKVQKKETYQKLKIWSRGSTILPEFIGHSFEIHNGKNFLPLTVTDEMVGHKFGEFSSTRNKPKPKKGKKNK
jgi:small subunit ribosomal protein S19